MKTSWQLQKLLGLHLLAALLLFSLFWPLARPYWEALDVSFFTWINSSLKDRPLWQLFWASANHKLADWVEDFCVLGFFIAYVRRAPPSERLRKVAELIVCVVCIALVIYCVNRVLFREHCAVPRLSPTLVVDQSVRLSQEISWMSVKESSSKSFPGDHGTTALLFATIFTYLAGWRLGIWACLYATFLCLPRLMTGAHWLSDVVVGSGSITLICASWIFCTPLFRVCTERVMRVFSVVIFRPKN